VRDVIVDGKFTLEVIINETRKSEFRQTNHIRFDSEFSLNAVRNSLGSSLDTTESTSLPPPTGDELERSSRDLFACSGNSNDRRNTPTYLIRKSSVFDATSESERSRD